MMMPLALAVALAATVHAAPTPLDPAIHAAVVAAVQARMGADADVAVTVLTPPFPAVESVSDAVLEPGATLGAPLRVALRAPLARAGGTALTPVAHLSVSVEVSVGHWHTLRMVRRGTRLAEDDLARVRHPFTRGALKALPGEDELVEGRALRDLAADACLTARQVAPAPAVVAGSDVVAIVREGGIEVRAMVVAVDSGRLGDRVRVVHPESRRTFRAYVIGRAEVEISHDR